MLSYLKKNRLFISFSILFIIISMLMGIGSYLENIKHVSLFGFNQELDQEFALHSMFKKETKVENKRDYPYGNVENNVILVNLNHQENKQVWLNEKKLKQADYLLNTSKESLQEYLKQISLQDVILQSNFYGYEIDGFKPSKPLDYYINDKQQADLLEAELLQEVIVLLNESQALKEKTTQQLDTNNDGFLDVVTFLLRGHKVQNTNLLWPHQFQFQPQYNEKYPVIETADGTLKVKDYNIVLSGDDGFDQSGIFHESKFGMGVLAHEILHIFGFPDLYHNYKYDETSKSFITLQNNEYTGDPLGPWDIMNMTNNEKPQLPLFYTNQKYSPWSHLLPKIEIVRESKSKITLSRSRYGEQKEPSAVILQVDHSTNAKANVEYFMVEYRHKSEWDDSIPGSGIIVYRINTVANTKNPISKINEYCSKDIYGKQKHCGNMFGPQDEVFIFRPNPETILSANVSTKFDEDLKKAMLSKESGRVSFGKSLQEVSKTKLDQFGSTIYFSDGSNSGIVISNVSNADADTITFDVEMPSPTFDNDGPIIQIQNGNGIKQQWINGTPRIYVYVKDEGKGIAELSVQSMDGAIVEANQQGKKILTKTYSKKQVENEVNFNFQVTTNGTYEVIAKDLEGNVTKHKFIVDGIDNELPSIQFKKSKTSKGKTLLHVILDDSQSGIDKDATRYAVLKEDEVHEDIRYTNILTNDVIEIEENFKGKICILAKDFAGNILKDNNCYVQSDDKEAPSIHLNIKSDVNQWSNQPFKADIIAQDNLKISSLTINLNGKHYQSAKFNDKEIRQELLFSKNGDYEMILCDAMQNCNVSKLTINHIDQIAPKITSIQMKKNKIFGLFPDNAYEISSKITEKGNSGVDSIYYQLVENESQFDRNLESDKWVAVNPKETLKQENSFKGIIYAYAKDHAGNVSNIYKEEVDYIYGHISEDSINEIKIIHSNISNTAIQTKVVYPNLKNKEDLKGRNILKTYQINFKNEKQSSTLENDTWIRFPITSEMKNAQQLGVVQIKDGQVKDQLSVLGSNFIEIPANEAGTYAIVAKSSSIDINNTNQVYLSSTGSLGINNAINYFKFVIFMLISIVMIYFFRKKKKEYEHKYGR